MCAWSGPAERTSEGRGHDPCHPSCTPGHARTQQVRQVPSSARNEQVKLLKRFCTAAIYQYIEPEAEPTRTPRMEEVASTVQRRTVSMVYACRYSSCRRQHPTPQLCVSGYP
jgi:hypothetical protein